MFPKNMVKETEVFIDQPIIVNEEVSWSHSKYELSAWQAYYTVIHVHSILGYIALQHAMHDALIFLLFLALMSTRCFVDGTVML